MEDVKPISLEEAVTEAVDTSSKTPAEVTAPPAEVSDIVIPPEGLDAEHVPEVENAAAVIPGNQFTKELGPMKFPGHLAWANERGHWPGCLAMEFKDDSYSSAVEKLNVFAKNNSGNHLITHIQFYPGQVYFVVTKVLSRKDLDRFERFNREVQAAMEKEEAKEKEAAEAAEKKQQEAQKEMKRLINVGKNCEHNHKKLKPVKKEEENA